MFDRSACAKVRVADAHVDVTALTNLAALLGHVLNDRFTSSNAPLSRVLNQNSQTASPDIVVR